MKFRTKSGSEYEVQDTWEGERVRRINSGNLLREDGEWVTLLTRTPIEVGYPVTMKLSGLYRWGVDENGDEVWGSTIRTTSTVTEVWG